MFHRAFSGQTKANGLNEGFTRGLLEGQGDFSPQTLRAQICFESQGLAIERQFALNGLANLFQSLQA